MTSIEEQLKIFKKDSQINPQLETGFRGIENKLLKAIIRAKLSGSEVAVLLSIIDLTWGWKQKIGKVKLSEIEEETGLKKRTVQKAIKELSERQIILMMVHDILNHTYRMTVVKYYDLWVKKGANKNAKNLHKCSCSTNICSCFHEQTYNPTYYKRKKEIYKEIIKELNDIIPVWNEYSHHNQDKTSDTLIQEFYTTLQHITKKQLTDSIINYGLILDSPDYYYTHSFSFQKFLYAGNIVAKGKKDKGYWMFLPENDPYKNFLRTPFKKNKFENYFEEIRLTHPFPKMAILEAQRTSGITNGIYMGVTLDFLKNSPYERYELLIQPYLDKGLKESHIIHIENIIVILIYQKKDEKFLKKMVRIHLDLLEKFNLKE